MPRMATFRASREHRDIAVNPANVLFVCHYENGVSALHFSKDCFVRVQGDLADVVHTLEQAMAGAATDALAGAQELRAH